MNYQIQNQESMLRESIKHFLASYDSGNYDFSSFESIFFRLIQTMLDPPLEISWFYSAVTFHAAKLSPQRNPSTRVIRAKDLLDLLISCSNLSSGLKKIALLAPVVYELYSIICDSRKNGLCVKKEVDKLVEYMTSYVVMSAGVVDYGNGDVEVDKTVVCFEDLVRVWTTDRGGGSCNFGENLRVFFPLLTDGTWKGLNGRCGIRELVGIVLCEVFFLRLYLSFGSGMCTEDLLKDTRDQVVETIKEFRNFYFLDMLLKMLLEPSLPVAALLSSEDAVLLCKVLYDAVLLVDYSSYYGGRIQSYNSYSEKLAPVWVLVADSAIQFARAATDQTRATSYLNAFSESQLVAELIKWATIQAGIVDRSNIPDISTPEDLIKWLLVLEDKGIRVFDHSSISVAHAKAVISMSEGESESPEVKPYRMNLNQNTFFCNSIDANKDQEMDDLSSNGFPSDLCSMNTKVDAGRKRKEALSGLQETRAKQVKHDFSGSSVGEKFLSFSGDNGFHCGSKVKSFTSDEDMEIVG
ncbi:hypothetical protein CDL12_10509 [Handroanthus impetiginosus]|uniref:Uncharacterized protein n=1 Tax=Handroanthus impetiginosus TaxID=429701 RepID=A0A2G9HH71_9LAMI|nr:hypothetical protein CDL12_10509 [Handroanthus impetiginosus]